MIDDIKEPWNPELGFMGYFLIFVGSYIAGLFVNFVSLVILSHNDITIFGYEINIHVFSFVLLVVPFSYGIIVILSILVIRFISFIYCFNLMSNKIYERNEIQRKAELEEERKKSIIFAKNMKEFKK